MPTPNAPTRKQPLYAAIAQLTQAIVNCERADNIEWLDKHIENRAALIRDYMPSGAGFDEGTHLVECKTTPDRLVFTANFHHMDENGSYTAWTHHTVVVTPSFAGGFDVRVTGRDRNNIKEYIIDTFSDALNAVV